LRPNPINSKTDFEDNILEAVLPTHYVLESLCPAKSKYSLAELLRLFGCNKFDFGTLQYLGDRLHVTTDREPPLTIGDTVNINCSSHRGPAPKPPRACHTIRANIGYGEGVGPGGYKYCLFLVNQAIRYTWVYGLTDLSGDCLADAMWQFFVNSGGFPRRFRCDFDCRFLHGKVGQLLWSHGIKIGASPPYRNSQNGAVEQNWNTTVKMGRSFPAEANLPKRYWFWAIREASIRMNMLPIKTRPATDDNMEFLDDPEDLLLDVATVQANLATTNKPLAKPKTSKPRSKSTAAKLSRTLQRNFQHLRRLRYILGV
jgi:hypothetical protein